MGSLRNNLQNERGFSFIEVLIASALVIVMSAALLSAHIMVRHSMKFARIHLEASEVTKSYLEREKAKTYSNIQTQAYNNVVLSDQGTADVTDDVLGTVQVNVTTNANSTKAVEARADWSHTFLGQSLTQNVSYTTLIADV